MSNKDYYQRWLKIKENIEQTLLEDERVQALAESFIGIKPQGIAVEIVARIYSRYCELYNKLCDCYDQMEQVQRRPYIKQIIDAVTCRLLEIKSILEEVEVFEYTYPDNALKQLLIIPENIEIICPFHYPFEMRENEMQYIIDQIFAGNRIGDPPPTESEIELREQQRLEEEEQKREEKEAEINRKLAMGEEIVESIELSPEEIKELQFWEVYHCHINNIQRMERARVTTREKTHKANKDANLYLELAGLKIVAKEEIRIKASQLIQKICRMFIELKQKHTTENKLKEKLGMVIPSWSPPSAKALLEKVKEERRIYRRQYYEKMIEKHMKEKTHVLRLRKDDIMEDISAEIRTWLQQWHKRLKLFDEFPWPAEGGSILIVKGETFTIEEYIDWRIAEDKRLKAEAAQPKSKDQIKAEKLAAKLEKKRMEAQAILKEKKRLLEYKKSRLNPDSDPGVYIKIGHLISPVQNAWTNYQNMWKHIDEPDAPLTVLKGFMNELLTEDVYMDVHLELRPIVDEMMKIELNLLKKSLKDDYLRLGIDKPPVSRKRKKPKRIKPPKPFPAPPEEMFQNLVDEGVIRKYPHTLLDDFWGDRNYAAADMRAISWTPSFPPPCIGDIKELIRLRCLLTIGSNCEQVERAQLLVGPKSSGKRTLIYAVATETNSILIDLSPLNIYNKYPGPKNMKTMFKYINIISKLMEPTIILVADVDKMFYKKVPRQEKMFNPTRLSRDFYKEIIKPIEPHNKILVLGTASEPWLSKSGAMYKIFPSLILFPRTDYSSISFVLTKLIMRYHGVNREFDVHTTAQALRGYNMKAIINGTKELLCAKRLAQLYHKPLEPMEVLDAVQYCENVVYTSQVDYSMFTDWYLSYSPWGEKYLDYMVILETQLLMKLKREKKGK